MRIFLLFLFCIINIFTQLDENFGEKGFVIHEDAAGVGNDFGQAVTIDDQNRIIVAGFSSNSNHGRNIDMTVWRYLENGKIDSTFAGKGFFVHDNTAGGNSDEEGNAITIDQKKRIIVVGRSRNANRDDDLAIWCLLPSGTLDTSFGKNGIAIHHNAAGGNSQDYGYAVSIDSDNRIVITGESYAPGFPPSSQMIIWRYLENGTLDTAFGNRGWIVQEKAWNWGYAVTTYNNNIFVAGKGQQPRGMYVWKYLDNGLIDRNFGNNGTFVHNIQPAHEFGDLAKSIQIDNAGKITITGRSSSFQQGRNMALWRIDTTGVLDMTLNQKGFIAHNHSKSDGYDTGQSVAIDKLGKIIVAGRSDGKNGNLDAVVWRYLSDGRPDKSFGKNGYIVHDNTAGGQHHDLAQAVAIDQKNRAIVVGWSFNKQGNYGMTIWCHR